MTNKAIQYLALLTFLSLLINVVLTLYFHNKFTALADLTQQNAILMDKVSEKVAENTIDIAKLDLVELYKKMASADKKASKAFHLFATSFLYWLIGSVFIFACSVFMFIKIKLTTKSIKAYNDN